LNMPTGGMPRHALVGFHYVLYTLNSDILLNSGLDRVVRRILKSPDNSPRSTQSAALSSTASPSASLLDRLDPNYTARPRRSNLHSARGPTYVPLPAASSRRGFRTPAARIAGSVFHAAASETLHKNGRLSGIHPPTAIEDSVHTSAWTPALRGPTFGL
jgi:hypothetical protein